MSVRRFLGLVLSLSLLFLLVAPAFAGDDRPDRPMTKRDLEGISPKRHRFLFNTIGGAAIGMGVGALLGGGKGLTKGLLIGGGAGSSWYLHQHPRALDGAHDWALIGSHTALTGGLGWTVCNCDEGFWGGSLIGGGGTAWWLAGNHNRNRQVGNNQP